MAVGSALAIGSLIGGLASAGGSIASGIMGSNAAHSAADTQSAAALQAAALAQSSADKANTGISDTLGTLGGLNDKNQALLAPYTSAGTTTLAQILAGFQPGGQFNKQFTAADMQQYDPGYQFRLQQGQQAIERSAAARGTQLSGGTLKDLTDYEQGAASAEYQNAFNRYQQQIQQTYGMMAGVTNLGLSAANSAIQGNQWLGSTSLQGKEAMGQNLMGAAQIAGADIVGAGNAQSAGTIGANNALWRGISGGVNSLGQLMMPTGAVGNVGGGFGPAQVPNSMTLGSLATQMGQQGAVPGVPMPPPAVPAVPTNASAYPVPKVQNPWTLGNLYF